MRIPRPVLAAGAAAAIVCLASGRAAAQAVAIDSGMTKAQVIEKFGKPSGERTRGAYTYLFFANGREKQVGMSDLVILREDKVVDAVLRSPARTYSGASSSPRALSASEARGPGAGTPLKRGGAGG
jgi:hypothetical protein